VLSAEGGGRISTYVSVHMEENSEIYREFFELDAEIAEFCPNMRILLQEQRINSEIIHATRMNKGDLLLRLS
jgi:hypothetical protein